MLSKEEEKKLLLADALRSNFCCNLCNLVKLKEYERVIEIDDEKFSVCPECEGKREVLTLSKEHGFHHENTGGGCEALVRNFNGFDIVITSMGGCAIPLGPVSEGVEIGVYKVDEPGLWDSPPFHYEDHINLHEFFNGKPIMCEKCGIRIEIEDENICSNCKNSPDELLKEVVLIIQNDEKYADKDLEWINHQFPRALANSEEGILTRDLMKNILVFEFGITSEGLPENIKDYICCSVDEFIGASYTSILDFVGLNEGMDCDEIRKLEGNLKEGIFQRILKIAANE